MKDLTFQLKRKMAPRGLAQIEDCNDIDGLITGISLDEYFVINST